MYGSLVIQSYLSFGHLLFSIKAVLLCKVPSAIHFQGFLSTLRTLATHLHSNTSERRSFKTLELITLVEEMNKCLL